MKKKNEVINEVANEDVLNQAVAEVNELKTKIAEAKAKLAAAKKSLAKSRPVRMFTFVTKVCQSKESALKCEGEFIFKSDVHYCAEKAVIDILTEDIKNNQTNEYYYIVCKQSKNDGSEVVFETLWVDSETKQIVIE